LTPDPAALAGALREPLLKVFPAALLGRLVLIPYYPLSEEMLTAIIRLQLGRIQKRIVLQHKIPFSYDEAVIKLIGSRCNELESGARVIDAILTNTVLPRISEQFLLRLMQGRSLARVHVGVENGDFTYDYD
jgi:type VI secretion system protein VasG